MNKVKFIEESHQYISEDDRELISVSAFTERFKNKVDWNAIAKKVAAKKTREGEPTTAQEVLTKWENKRDRAAQIGTSYHSFRELDNNIVNFYNVKCDVEFCPVIDNYKWSLPINQLRNNTEYRELMIYDMEYMICGQADKVIVVNNKINIWDYKTDAEIKFKAFSSKWVDPAMMLPPLTHLEECNANIYSLKMSMYMYLLWKSNRGLLKPGDIILEHIHLKRDPNDDNLPVIGIDGKPIVLKIEKIKLPYRKKEIMDMLKTIK